MSNEFSRRDLLMAGAGLIVMPVSPAQAIASRSRSFRVIETAGLRRFGYPVHTILTEIGDEKAFRLTRQGKPVAAQLRRVVGADGKPALAIDFNTSPGPLEAEDYVLEFGQAGSEGSAGLTVDQRDGSLWVLNGKSARYAAPTSLAGLVQAVENSGLDFLEAGGQGLIVRERSGQRIAVGGPVTIASVSREGPFAVGFRFETALERGGTERFPVVVDMTFPRSKSWIEVTVGLDDPEGRIAALDIDLKLKLDGTSPTLVDFGALGTVYGSLKPSESMALVGGGTPDRAWAIESGLKGSRKPFAVAPPTDNRPAEGWAHVMDRRRCTAVALAGFGRTTTDRIEVGADGRLGISRVYPEGDAGKGRKALTFWLHFVPMPVQIGAVTSPQAMLAPLQVVWS